MEWDINSEWGVQTHEAQVNILQIKTLKTIMTHIKMREL